MTRYSDQPDIMSIGDSLYQGIRSLSFVPSMTTFSPPAQVARALGRAMTVPDLKQPLLFDLEADIKQGDLVNLSERIRGLCLANLAHWPLDQPWSQHEAFDNIAIGGAQIASLAGESYAQHWAEISPLIATLNQAGLPAETLLTTIGNLWYALSNCYTLNPRHRREQAETTALRQVEDRQPNTLLIDIGSNDGLFDAAFLGDVSDDSFKTIGTIPTLLKPVAERLARLPARTTRIVFNNLVRPRCIPNLMPSPFEENKSPGESYFTSYGPRSYSTQQAITADRLRALDALVAQVNAEVSELMKSTVGDRLVIADLYGTGQSTDGKHFSDRALIVPGGGPRIVNRPLTPTFGGFIGGLTGLDNMHPTAPGYAVMADAVLDALGHQDIRTDKAAAYKADTLLNGFDGLAVVRMQAELSLLGTFASLRSSSGKSATTSTGW